MEGRFEGLSREVKGEALTCIGTPTCFIGVHYSNGLVNRRAFIQILTEHSSSLKSSMVSFRSDL